MHSHCFSLVLMLILRPDISHNTKIRELWIHKLMNKRIWASVSNANRQRNCEIKQQLRSIKPIDKRRLDIYKQRRIFLYKRWIKHTNQQVIERYDSKYPTVSGANTLALTSIYPEWNLWPMSNAHVMLSLFLWTTTTTPYEGKKTTLI